MKRYEVASRFTLYAESAEQAQAFAAAALEYYDFETGEVNLSGVGAPEGHVSVREIEETEIKRIA